MTTYTAPLEVVQQPASLRQSWIRLFDRCPHSGLLYLKHDGGPKNHPMMRGIVFHATVERLAKACLENGESKVDHHHAKAVLQEVLMENPDWVVPVSDMDALRVMLFHWAEHFEVPPNALVEQKFHLTMEGYTVSGTIDICWVTDGTLHVRDYKAGLGLISQDDISSKDAEGQPKGAKALQLIVYALLAADGMLVDENGEVSKIDGQFNTFDLRFVFPFFSNDDGLLERGLVMERHELIEHRDWLKVLLNRVTAGFATGQWPAIPGSHCSTCPAPQECPIPPTLRQMQGISPYERDPSELGEEAMFITEDRKRLIAALKGYAEQFGPIPVGSDLEWSHKKVESQRLTREGKAAQQAGLSVPADAYTTSTSTRFDLRKRGEGF